MPAEKTFESETPGKISLTIALSHGRKINCFGEVGTGRLGDIVIRQLSLARDVSGLTIDQLPQLFDIDWQTDNRIIVTAKD